MSSSWRFCGVCEVGRQSRTCRVPAMPPCCRLTSRHDPSQGTFLASQFGSVADTGDFHANKPVSRCPCASCLAAPEEGSSREAQAFATSRVPADRLHLPLSLPYLSGLSSRTRAAPPTPAQSPTSLFSGPAGSIRAVSPGILVAASGLIPPVLTAANFRARLSRLVASHLPVSERSRSKSRASLCTAAARAP